MKLKSEEVWGKNRARVKKIWNKKWTKAGKILFCSMLYIHFSSAFVDKLLQSKIYHIFKKYFTRENIY